MGKFLSDFKKFATKGNVMDMAIGVVIGAAFGKITTSLVNDIIMPLISLITGGASIASLKWVIRPAVFDANGVLTAAETALKYGNFLQTMMDFLIIAFSIFLVLRIIMKAKEGLSSINETLLIVSKKEKRELLKKGVSIQEIEKMEKEKAEEAKKLAAEEKAKADAEIKANAPETILKEIRDLLIEQKQGQGKAQGQGQEKEKK